MDPERSSRAAARRIVEEVVAEHEARAAATAGIPRRDAPTRADTPAWRAARRIVEETLAEHAARASRPPQHEPAVVVEPDVVVEPAVDREEPASRVVVGSDVVVEADLDSEEVAGYERPRAERKSARGASHLIPASERTSEPARDPEPASEPEALGPPGDEVPRGALTHQLFAPVTDPSAADANDDHRSESFAVEERPDAAAATVGAVSDEPPLLDGPPPPPVRVPVPSDPDDPTVIAARIVAEVLASREQVLTGTAAGTAAERPAMGPVGGGEPVGQTGTQVLVSASRGEPVSDSQPASDSEPDSTRDDLRAWGLAEPPVREPEFESTLESSEEPAPVFDDESAPVFDDEPVPLFDDESAPVFDEEPVPVFDEEPALVYEDASAPPPEQRSAALPETEQAPSSVAVDDEYGAWPDPITPPRRTGRWLITTILGALALALLLPLAIGAVRDLLSFS